MLLLSLTAVKYTFINILFTKIEEKDAERSHAAQ